nr:fusion protein [Paramyxoviridae sp.]
MIILTMYHKVCILYIILAISSNYINCQVAFTELSSIGIIKGKNFGLKVTGGYSTQVMVLKLIPNMDNLTECTKSALDNYKQTLVRVMTPIKQAMDFTRSAIKDKQVKNLRFFFGAIVGGVALGVATSAQITAGIALHNSLENAKAISSMRDAILATNTAVEELHNSQLQSVMVFNALQNKINSQIIPMLNSLGCQLSRNTLELYLNRYLSEISLIFGPNLRDPGFATLSVQAIASAFNGDFDTLSRSLGYSGKDFLDLMESNSITGRIIDISIDNFYIVIQIEYPILTTITDAIIQEFNLISYNYQGIEWISVYPNAILIRGGYLSNIELKSCVRTKSNYVCRQDTSIPMSDSLYKCTKGNVSSCARTRVINAHVPKFVLSDGIVFANCIATICKCQDPSYMIVQEQDVTTTMVSSERCNELLIDNVFITVGKSSFKRGMFASNVTVGAQVSVDPVDVSNELASIQISLNKTKSMLDKSNSILRGMKEGQINGYSFIIVCCLTGLTMLWCLILTLAMCKVFSKIRANSEIIPIFANPRNMGSLNTISP